MLCRIFPLYIYKIPQKDKTRWYHHCTRLLNNTPHGWWCVGGTFVPVSFLSATVRAACPEGWHRQSGATGLVFNTESTVDEDRIRCFSSDDSDRQVWDVVGPFGAAWCSTASGGTLCIARSNRCSVAGGQGAMFQLSNMWFCRFCNAGAIRSGDRCNNCGQNQYRAFGTGNACQNCPVGTVSRPGSASITDCMETGCDSCGIGTYNEDAGGTVCKQCPAGTFEERTGQQVCTSCPGGTYSWPRVHVYAMQYFVVQRNANANT